MVSKVVSLNMPEDLLERLDSIRGDVPRSAYVRKLIDRAIANAGKRAGGGTLVKGATAAGGKQKNA